MMRLTPSQCVLVDDVEANLPPAGEIGMTTILHRNVSETLARLEQIFEVSLT